MEITIIRPYGPDVVHAPPAFKGQQSAKGATKARFAMVAERIKKANTVTTETKERIKTYAETLKES